MNRFVGLECHKVFKFKTIGSPCFRQFLKKVPDLTDSPCESLSELCLDVGV